MEVIWVMATLLFWTSPLWLFPILAMMNYDFMGNRKKNSEDTRP